MSSHGSVCAGEMAQRVKKSCSRMKNFRDLPESTFAAAPVPQEKRKFFWQKLTLFNVITAKFQAELIFGSQILPKRI